MALCGHTGPCKKNPCKVVICHPLTTLQGFFYACLVNVNKNFLHTYLTMYNCVGLGNFEKKPKKYVYKNIKIEANR